MNFIEFVSFIFTLFVMVWLMMRRMSEARQIPPEEMEERTEEEQRELREFMERMNLPMEPVKPPKKPKFKKPVVRVEPPVSQPTLVSGYTFQDGIDPYEQTQGVRSRQLELQDEPRYKPQAPNQALGSDNKLDIQAYALVEKPSRLKNILTALPTRQQMIIIHEVLTPPKSFDA